MKYHNCKNSNFIIDILKKNASNSQMRKKHASCLFKNDNIYSFGVNKYYNTKDFVLSIHAEIDALASVKKTQGMDLIVIRYEKGILKISKPCINCIEKMIKCGINKVYYSDINGDIICEYTTDIEKTHTSSGFKNIETCRI